MSTNMPRWEVTIKFAKPPTYTCDVEAANEDGAIIRAIMRASDDGFSPVVKHTKATKIQEDTTDDSRTTFGLAQSDDAGESVD